MAMTTCTECKTAVSSEAEICPNCGVRVKPKAKVWRWVFGVPVALVVLFLAFGASLPANPEKTQDRRAYELCMSDLASADRARNGTSSFVAGTCEMMRNKYIQKYNSTP